MLISQLPARLLILLSMPSVKSMLQHTCYIECLLEVTEPLSILAKQEDELDNGIYLVILSVAGLKEAFERSFYLLI